MKQPPIRIATVLLSWSLCFLLTAAAVHAKQPKQDVCHLDKDTGTFKLINVAAPAVPAHLGHGDMFPLVFYPDLDGDGFGAGAASEGCEVPPGFVENDDDCDDGNAAINPAAAEICDGVDNNCSGEVDEGLTFDDDGDSFTSLDSCLGSADDCDDGDAAINPGAAEVCDGVDNNCSGDVDEGLTFDDDGDGFTSVGSCEGSADDCDDGDAGVNPGATEVCDSVDNNCDGDVDEGLTFDDDGDGFTSVGSCEGSADDCDDGDAAINPGADEVCDGIDNDCDGAVDEGGVCGGKTVFVSSMLYSGNFGSGFGGDGLAGADASCQNLADNAALSGTFKAWISGRPDGEVGGGGQDVLDRFTQSPGPYNLVDGTKVADSFADLTDGTLDHAIDRTELNTPVGAEIRVWTNSKTDGNAFDIVRDCALNAGPDTWTCTPVTVCPFESGNYGSATSASSTWTTAPSNNTSCDTALHLYCFEQ